MLYRFSMRILPRSTGVALAALATLLLSGCLPSAPVVTPEPLPTSTPVFASDADALAAATDAYARYLAVSDQILKDGGTTPDRIEAVTTGEKLETELASYTEVQLAGYHSTGDTTFDHVALQRYAPQNVDGVGIVVLYLCEDVSRVNVMDASGTSVVSADRPARVLYEVAFDLVLPGSDHLLVANKQPWSSEPC